MASRARSESVWRRTAGGGPNAPGASSRPLVMTAWSSVPALYSAVGHRHLVSLCRPAGELSGARRGHRVRSLERGQTAGHPGHDVFSFALGPAALVAGNGAGLWHQLGVRLSVRGMVRGLGVGASGAGRDQGHRGGRNILGARPQERGFSDGYLSD